MSTTEEKRVVLVLDRKGIERGNFDTVMAQALGFAIENPETHNLVIVPHWVWVADLVVEHVAGELYVREMPHTWRYNFQTLVLKNRSRLNFKPATLPGVRENLEEIYDKSFEIVDSREEVNQP